MFLRAKGIVMGVQIKGLDALKKRFEKLQQNAQALDGTHEVKLVDMVTPAFVREHTGYSDLGALITASGLTTDEFAADTSKIDGFIQSKTSFATWKEFLNAAKNEYVKKKPFA